MINSACLPLYFSTLDFQYIREFQMKTSRLYSLLAGWVQMILLNYCVIVLFIFTMAMQQVSG